MIKLNTKRLLIISSILGLVSLVLAVIWYYQIENDIKDDYLKNNKVNEFPAWFWVRLILWPALIILISSGLYFLNNSIWVEIGSAGALILGIIGTVLSFFTFKYNGVDQELDANNVTYIVLVLSYTAGIIANSIIVINLFTHQKEAEKAGVLKSKQMLKEDIIDIQ